MFSSINDVCSKLSCKNKTNVISNFFKVKNEVFSEGITLYQDSALTSYIPDGLYIFNNQVFNTVNGVVSFKDCSSVVEPCLLTLSWDQTRFNAVCYSTTIEKTVAVSGSNGLMVEFSIDGGNTWQDATTGNDIYTFTTAKNDGCTGINYRLKDCPTITEWGCIQKICAEDIDPCTLSLSWDTPRFTTICNNNNSTIEKTVAVSGANGLVVEFSLDNVTWSDANLGNDRFVFTTPLNTDCTEIYYRLKDCPTITEWGCISQNCITTVVDCSTTEANPHECNITDGTHHGYYDFQTNSVLGIFASEQGEVKIYGSSWLPTTYLGMGENGLRFVGYKEPYQGAAVVVTRTKSGCTEFQDGQCNNPRTIEVVSINHNQQKYNLNTTQSHLGSTIDFDGFWTSYHLHSGSVNTDVYSFTLKNTNMSNLQWRINNSSWNSTSVNSNVTSLDNLGSAATNIPKDFILELRTSDGVNSDKFIVRSWTNLGHFTVTTTMTRLRDNQVFVSTYIGEHFLPSYIRFSNSTVVNSISQMNTSFKLPTGLLTSDQSITFGFQETGIDWIDITLLTKDN